MDDKTMNFEKTISQTDIGVMLQTVSETLEQKGYNSKDQIIGYLISGDPSYIPRDNNARNLIKIVERNGIIEFLLSEYLKGE